MSEHRATVEWQRSGEFRYETYSRSHKLKFDQNLEILGLWFLHVASRAGWVVDRYLDEAVGILDKTWISRVTLRPAVTFSGSAPSRQQHVALHEKAHEKCFIANSVKTQVVVEPC